jgi:hypothetical protein
MVVTDLSDAAATNTEDGGGIEDDFTNHDAAQNAGIRAGGKH